MRTWVIAVILASRLAAADDDHDVKAKPAVSAADQKKYQDLLRKGRQLETKQKFPEAIAAFEDGLKVIADDATLLAEIGWTAYQAKDLKRAEAMTRKSLANEAAPNLRGASLYNLGKIQEDLKDTRGAIASYSESLRVRPNGVVRAALKKLDPAAAATFDPFKPAALLGPFASIDAYCKTTSPTEEDGYLEDCSCGDRDPKEAKPTLGKPFDDAIMFTRVCSAPHTENARSQYFLGLRVGKSWFVTKYADQRENRHCNESLTNDSVTAADGVLQLRATETGSCAGGDVGSDWTTQLALIVGVGASGVPAATPPIVIKKHMVDQIDMFGSAPKKRTTADIVLDLVLSKDKTLEIKGKTTGLDKGEASNVLGKHALVFP
ncbi:MAG: hypothetical protein JWO36_5198 [Myxococcales bacterium]|nr:hypothetical protein [Myxococcales bacterium]